MEPFHQAVVLIRMCRLLVYVCIFAFCSNVTSAQSIELSGRVIDRVERVPLPYANVFAVPGHYGTVTDLNGNYRLVLKPDVQFVVVSYVGMMNDTFVVSAPNSNVLRQDFKLISLSFDVIPEVVVSASRYGQRVNESTVSIQTLTSKQIENRNTVNIKSVMEQVPGLTILDEEPQIRGGSGFSFGVGSRVATLVDGLPLLTGDAGRTEWSFIPTENIGRVEVLQGASSVLYGSSALSGTINFLTRIPDDDISTNIRTHFGMYRAPGNKNAKWWNGIAPFSGVSVIHSGTRGQHRFSIGGRINYDHGYIGPYRIDNSLPFAVDTLENKDVAERTGRLNFTYARKLGRMELGLSGNLMAGHNNFSLVWGDGQDDIYRAYPGSLTVNDFFYFYLDPSFSYESSNGFKHAVRSRIYFTDNNNSNNQDNQALTTMVDAGTSGTLGASNINLAGGVFFSSTVSKANLYASGGSPDNQARNIAGYVQLDRKFFKKLIVQMGGRLEYFRINNESETIKPVFRGGLNYEPFKGTNCRASIGQGFRYPTITEKFISTSTGGLAVFPNPSVKPESSIAMEIGIRQGFKIKSWYGYLDVAAFHQDYENTIEYIFAAWRPGSSGFKFVNTGDTEVRGFESAILIEGHFSEKLELTMNTSFTFIEPLSKEPDHVFGVTEPEDGFVPEELTYSNTSTDPSNGLLKYRFRHMAKFDLEIRFGKWMAGSGLRYYSFMENIDKAFYDFDLQENPNYPDGIISYREENPNGTIVQDARVGFKPTDSWSVLLVFENLANRQYSLRPMKIESPGTIALQLNWKPR